MNAPQQTETAQPTPEQLMQLLDLQLASERGKRAGHSRNRAMILVFGLLAIVAAGAMALTIAQEMLLDLQQRGAGAQRSESAATTLEK